MINLQGESKNNTYIECGDDSLYFVINVYRGNNVKISEFTVKNADKNGISFGYCNNGIVTNCDFYHLECGIHVATNASNVEISNCNAYSNEGSGVAINYCGDVIIENCSFHSNNYSGIYIQGDTGIYEIKNCDVYSNRDGIIMSHADNVKIAQCNIYNNENGIWLASRTNITITGNNIDNNGYGIWVHSSSDITDISIYQNNFINNNFNSIDEGNNKWDNGKQGNYWDDYKEKYPDAKRIWLKGVWDTPYEIDGGENQDNYPLITPYRNNPPNKPSPPTGETSGKSGEEYIYTSSTTDPDGDEIFYLFDWGNGMTSFILGSYNSGEECNASGIWFEKGNYEIKVKAIDIHGEESPWSDPLPITMPKNKAINPFLLFLERLMERFPILEQILQQFYIV